MKVCVDVWNLMSYAGDKSVTLLDFYSVMWNFSALHQHVQEKKRICISPARLKMRSRIQGYKIFRASRSDHVFATRHFATHVLKLTLLSRDANVREDGSRCQRTQ